MTHTTLHPSLASIERQFSTFPDSLLKNWLERPEILDSDFLHQLENSTHAQNERKRYLNSNADEEIRTQASPLSTTQKIIPTAIQVLIKQRCQSLKHHFDQTPKAGKIVVINGLTPSTPSIHFHLNKPLLVLLDTPTFNASIWQGWLVTHESEYASYWDADLDPELDVPLDPLAKMVQLWNPVMLHVSTINRVIGELNTNRLSYMQNMAVEYQQHNKDEDEDEDEGIYTDRKPQQLAGKPILNQDDPRNRYQELYAKAAKCVSDTAEECLLRQDTITEPSSFNLWLHQLFSHIDQATARVVPQVNYAMGDDENNDLLIGNLLRFRFRRRISNKKDDFLVDISLRVENQKNCSLEFFEDENLEHYFQFSIDEPETHVLYDPESEGSEFVIRDESDKVIHRFSLKKG